MPPKKASSAQGKTAHTPVMEQGPSTRARGKQKAVEAPAMDIPEQGSSPLSQITDEIEQERIIDEPGQEYYYLVFFYKSTKAAIVIPPTLLVRELQRTILQLALQKESVNNGRRLTFWKVQVAPEAIQNNADVERIISGQGTEFFNPDQPIRELWNTQPPVEYVHIVVKSPMKTGGLGHLEPGDVHLLEQFRDAFITVQTFGDWTKHDVSGNRIKVARSSPQFIVDYEHKLSAKRRVPVDLLPHAQTLVGEIFNEYCDQDANHDMMTKDELIHLAHITTIDQSKYWRGKFPYRSFKEPDASWLLFYAISSPYEVHETLGRVITVKLGESWPFELIIQNPRGDRRFVGPESDFAVFGSSVPRLLMEVNSTQSNQPPKDLYRMLLQAASVVRFANGFLGPYTANKDFVAVAAYIGASGDTERFILFQDKDRDPELRQVFYKTRIFKFGDRVDLVQFVLEIYNILSALGKEEYDSHMARVIQYYKQKLADYYQKHDMKRLPHRTKPPTDGRENHGFDNRGIGGGEGMTDQLESHGYMVIPDYFEDESGWWGTLTKLPPHIRTVHRSMDAERTELIAKHIGSQSHELEILEYIGMIQPPSLHIIHPIDTIPSNTGKWIIFPKLHDIRPMCCDNPTSCGRLAQFARDLIDGLAYLHNIGIAHLDIKPENLLCTNDFRLRIIDFDSAVRVDSEDSLIVGVHGTEGWMAPEVRDSAPFSPIRADKWTCGKMLLWFLEKRITKNEDLVSFAKRLMDYNPRCRPSLVEWSAGLDKTDYDTGLNRPTKRQKVDDRVR